MSQEQAIMAELRRRGLKMKDCSPEVMREIALKTRTLPQIASAAISYSAATVRTKVLGWTVPLPILQVRKSGCEANTCGLFRRIHGQRPVCVHCGCSGDDLEMKWQDPESECPVKVWLKYNAQQPS